MVHVLQTTQNLVILRWCFAEDGKEMYQGYMWLFMPGKTYFKAYPLDRT